MPILQCRYNGQNNEERVDELMNRVEANDAGAMTILGSHNYHGKLGLLRDQERAMELWTRAAELGSSQAHFQLGTQYDAEGNSKKKKFHNEAAAMAGHEGARYNLGLMELKSGKYERAVKHLTIAASAGDYGTMNCLR